MHDNILRTSSRNASIILGSIALFGGIAVLQRTLTRPPTSEKKNHQSSSKTSKIDQVSRKTTLSKKRRTQRPTFSAVFTHEQYRELAKSLGIRPPARKYLPRCVVTFLGRGFRWYHQVFIHFLFGENIIPNSSLSLSCLWWKAMSGNDRQSILYDSQGLAYNMLPSIGRFIISPVFLPLYPRWLHANVEIRTAFLNNVCQQIIQTERQRGKENHPQQKRKQVRLVTFGGGYDVRSVKLLSMGLVDQAVELDLPKVVQAKRALFKILQSRRPCITEDFLPRLYEVNLNDVGHVESVLRAVLSDDGGNDDDSAVTIFLFEAILLYLDDTVPLQLLSLCSQVLLEQQNTKTGYLCFADRLNLKAVANIAADCSEERKNDNQRKSNNTIVVTDGSPRKEGQRQLAAKLLSGVNWELEDWLLKPGATQHLGCAKLLVVPEGNQLHR